MLCEALLGLAASAALAVPVPTQSAEELIAKSLEARGGLARLQAIKSVRMTGVIGMGVDEIPIVIEIKRPASVRSELKIDAAVLVQAYDGQEAWGVAPGDLGAQRLPPEMAKDVAARADLEGPLADYVAKGNRVELRGMRDTDFGEAHVLRVTKPDGEVEDHFLDADTFLPVRIEARRKVQGRELVAVTTFDDYEEVGGLKWAHTIESGVQGQAERQRLTIEKIVIDPTIDDSRFQKPAAAEPPKRN